METCIELQTSHERHQVLAMHITIWSNTVSTVDVQIQ